MPSGRVPVENGELAYELRGEGDPVILLHGGMLDSRMWDAEMKVLEGRYTAIRYDARGHGESSMPTERFKHYEDLRTLMTALELPRASLVGLSGGGRIAVDFALTYPDLVEKLVLVATGLSAMKTKDPFVLEQKKNSKKRVPEAIFPPPSSVFCGCGWMAPGAHRRTSIRKSAAGARRCTRTRSPGTAAAASY